MVAPTSETPKLAKPKTIWSFHQRPPPSSLAYGSPRSVRSPRHPLDPPASTTQRLGPSLTHNPTELDQLPAQVLDGVPMAAHMRRPSFFGIKERCSHRPRSHTCTRTGFHGGPQLTIRELDLKHKRPVLDPDLHPLTRSLVLNERAALVEHDTVPALDYPGGGRQWLPDPSHVEFDRTGHLPVLDSR